MHLNFLSDFCAILAAPNFAASLSSFVFFPAAPYVPISPYAPFLVTRLSLRCISPVWRQLETSQAWERCVAWQREGRNWTVAINIVTPAAGIICTLWSGKFANVFVLFKYFFLSNSYKRHSVLRRLETSESRGNPPRGIGHFAIKCKYFLVPFPCRGKKWSLDQKWPHKIIE